jgi:hypothetical protein
VPKNFFQIQNFTKNFIMFRGPGPTGHPASTTAISHSLVHKGNCPLEELDNTKEIERYAF